MLQDYGNRAESPVSEAYKAKLLSLGSRRTSDWFCHLCKGSLRSRRLFDFHVAKSHSLWLCRECGATLKSQGSYYNHVKRKHEGCTVPCGVDDCDKVFRWPSQLTRHREKEHGIEPLMHYDRENYICMGDKEPRPKVGHYNSKVVCFKAGCTDRAHAHKDNRV